jgi:hypothetical protein
MDSPFDNLSFNADKLFAYIRSQARKKGMSDLAVMAAIRLEAPQEEPYLAEIEAAMAASAKNIEVLKYPSTISDKDTWVPWYHGPFPDDLYWPAVRNHILTAKKWKEETVDVIDEATTKILHKLHDPFGKPFNTRGLVLGYVQSGKTANFLALVAKAADAGYKFIIVLSGLTNSLRKQTQERFDSDLHEACGGNWLRWTSTESDFSRNTMDPKVLLNADHKHLVVTKKNETRLRELLAMMNASKDSFANTPILVIDDECDQASVNASGKADDPTTINKLLREIIGFPRVAYVGYTATPFANILTDVGMDDIYPRDFISALPMPKEYFGAERLFGRDALLGEVIDEDTGLDMIRRVDDGELPDLRPAKAEDREDFVMAITPSLRNAILYFWLATAARASRGQGDGHSSMLIHTTFYSAPHLNAKPVVEAFRDATLKMIASNDPSLMTELNKLWETETDAVPAESVGCTRTSFDELAIHLAGVVGDTEVAVENSESDNRLDYRTPGRRYIAIGGNVLARGLTLEGLVVSYFARNSSQYDSLMQMGRWFGYRPGYSDLPRVWMTETMESYFRDMATLEAEIRRDISVYEKDESATPRTFAVRVRQHPELAITSKKKMIGATTIDISFGRRYLQTIHFEGNNVQWLERNWNAGATLIDKVNSWTVTGGSQFASSIPVKHVLKFLDDYALHTRTRFRSTDLTNYIRTQNQHSGSLTKWTVNVVGTQNGKYSDRSLGKLGRVPTVERSKIPGTASNDTDIRVLMSRSDALVDLDAEDPKTWPGVLDLRRTAEPMLLIYPISRDSKSNSKHRVDLNASADILGIGLVFPHAAAGTAGAYVKADLTPFEDEEEVTYPKDNPAGPL